MFKTFLKIITFPVWFPLLCVFAVLLLAVNLVFSLSGLAVCILAAAFTTGGIAVAVLSILSIQYFSASLILGIGAGLILTGFGILTAIAGLSLCIKAVPGISSFLKNIFRKCFSSKKNKLPEVIK